MLKTVYFLIFSLLACVNCQSQEIFADYFDISWGAISGQEVMGKLN